MASRLRLSRLQYQVIGLCILINILDGFDILAMAYAAPAVAEAWQLGAEKLGLLFSLGLGGMMAGSMMLGPMADRVGRRPTILALLLVAALAMFASSFTSSMAELGAARIVTGLAIGGILPCINTMVAEYAPQESRALAISVLQSGFAAGATFGGLLAAGLLSAFGWPSIFLAGAALTALLVPAVALGMPESMAFLEGKPQRAAQKAALLAKLGEHGERLLEQGRAKREAPPENPQQMSGSVKTPFALISFAFFVSVLGFYSLTSWVPKLMVDKGLTQTNAVVAGAMLTAGGIVACFLVGWLSLHRPIVTVVAIATAFAGPFSVAFGLMPADPVPVFLAAFLLGLAISGTQVGLYAIIPSLFPARVRAGATGLAIGIGRFGALLGPWIVGIALAEGAAPLTVFVALAVMYVVCMFVILTLTNWQRY